MAIRAASALSCLTLVRAISEAHVQDARRSQVSDAANATEATEEEASGVCDCMSWADVYFSGKAWCGRTKELYFLSKYGFSAAYAATEPITGLPHKVCVDFFKNFMTPSCVNIDLYPSDYRSPEDKAMSMDGKQWCYVSNDCAELNGGEYATNDIGFAMGGWSNLESTNKLSWKVCDPAKDDMLKYKNPAELVEIGQYSDVSLSRIFRMAYPVVEITWGEAKYFMETLNNAYVPGATLSDLVDGVPAATSDWGDRLLYVHPTIGDIVKSKQGTILDTPGHGDNFHVIHGRAVWEVKRIELGNMAYLGGHFSMEFNVNCTVGCASPEPLNRLDLLTE